MTESPSTGSGGQSSVTCPDGLPVYREILRPYNAVIQSVHNLHRLSIHIFQHRYRGASVDRLRVQKASTRAHNLLEYMDR